jgi:hypothetical protein
MLNLFDHKKGKEECSSLPFWITFRQLDRIAIACVGKHARSAPRAVAMENAAYLRWTIFSV